MADEARKHRDVGRLVGGGGDGRNRELAATAVEVDVKLLSRQQFSGIEEDLKFASKTPYHEDEVLSRELYKFYRTSLFCGI